MPSRNFLTLSCCFLVLPRLVSTLRWRPLLVAALCCFAALIPEPFRNPRVAVADETGLGESLGLTGQMTDDLMFLTSDELEGRSSVEPVIQEAANYLAKRFQSIGLKTDLFEGSAFQMVDISVGPQASSVESNQVAINRSPTGLEPIKLVLGESFNPLAIGSTKGRVKAPLVWVGYGINSNKYQYNDYAGIDVQGKVVMMMRKEPGAADPDSPFDGVKNTRHAFFDTKVATAIDAGAAAVIIVNDSSSIQRKVAEIENRRNSELDRIAETKQRLESLPLDAVNIRKNLASQIARAEAMVAGTAEELLVARRGLLEINEAGTNPRGGNEEVTDSETGDKSKRGPIPVISLSRDVADQLMRASGTSALKEGEGLDRIVEMIDGDFQPQSFPIQDAVANIQVELTPSIFKSPNVVATLPGEGELAEQTIVIGAHYDHVGMGGYGSLAPGTVAVHNGADDNASGTAVLLQVAGNLVGELTGQENRRRVVFIAFTGEERGLLGSKHYVQQPRFPISNTVAMVNMDMVGRLNDNELTVYGTESSDVMDGLLDTANEKFRFKLDRVGTGYGPSDHASFYAAEVPVLFFFTGLHSDYHRPSDDFDKLNLDGMGRITDMITQVSERLATMPERPEYKQTEANVRIRRQLTVFMGVQLSQQPGEVVFSSILASGPAETGGLVAGDVLLSLAGKPVAQIDEVFQRLRRFSPGDLIPLVIRRDGKSMKMEIKVRAR